MRNALWTLLFVLLFSFPIACQKQGQVEAKKPRESVEVDVAAIKALVGEWVRLYNAREFVRLMSVFYTENAIVMSPNAPAHKGKAAILQMYQTDDELNLEYVDSSIVEDVGVSGGLAVARGTDKGTTTSRSGGVPAKYDLKWLMVFEREPDRSWKCLLEMWNDNLPLETPKKEPASTKPRPELEDLDQ